MPGRVRMNAAFRQPFSLSLCASSLVSHLHERLQDRLAQLASHLSCLLSAAASGFLFVVYKHPLCLRVFLFGGRLGGAWFVGIVLRVSLLVSKKIKPRRQGDFAGEKAQRALSQVGGGQED